MSVNTTLAGLSQNPSLNGPDGASDPPSALDDSIRYHGAFIAQLRDGNGVTYAFGSRNRLRNGNFSINQRGLTGTVTLAPAAYGHDGWKAGASGCTYTFSTTNGDTTISILAGSLLQAVEGIDVHETGHVLTWVGTAQGKVGAGSYGASGVTGSGTPGSNLAVEFLTGTLGLVQLAPGSTATAFERMPYALMLLQCQRYYRQLGVQKYSSYSGSAATMQSQFMGSPMRQAPIVTLGNANVAVNASNITLLYAADGGAYWSWNTSAIGQSYWEIASVTLDAEL